MAKYNENGTIDTEINHPEFGLIPITLAKDDPETAELFEEYKDSAEPYEPPLPEELKEQARLKKVSEAKSYLESTDWIVTKITEIQLAGGDVEALKVKYATELAERKLMREVI
jgi:hypothetical protein